MRILLFLLDTLFFFLVGAALLRGWMNTRRLRMTQQPGLFVMAITDWIVRPMRKVLPRGWAQVNADWGSFLAGLALALAYSFCFHALFGGQLSGLSSLGWMLTLPVVAITFLLRTVLQGLMLLTLAYAVLSWVQPQAPVQATLARLVEPLLAPFRRWVPVVGGFDLSTLLLILLLQIGLMLLG